MTDIKSFHQLALQPQLIAALDSLGITTPTPIQARAVPGALEGKDVIGIAQTGTGKTLAFGLPTIERLSKEEGNALILVPTRELALQVEESLLKIARPFGIRTALLIGGASMRPQLDALYRNPRIVVATPGRLIDHLEQGTIRLTNVKVLILDEADRMLDMGFWPQIKKIIATVPKERQTMLFSATLSREIRELATTQMKLPVQIEVAPPGTTADKVSQEFFIVRKEDKSRLLEKVLASGNGQTIVFIRTKHGAKKVRRAVDALGHDTTEIHGNRSLNQRREALEGFKTGKYRVLIATDVASRGIDVKNVDLVINFDMPEATEDYVHRIGRTARAGAEGHAISFVEPNQKNEIRHIERLIRKTIPMSNLPELPPQRALSTKPEDRDEVRHRGFSRGGSSFGGQRGGHSRSGGGHSRGGGNFRRR